MDPAQTVAGVELRPVEQLAAELDLHYCWHWQLRHTDGDEDVVRERRLALEWLFAGEDWEEITLDT